MNAPDDRSGWFDDPTGRFGRRWYDGAAWTDHVVGANGQQLDDPMPERDVPFPPPSPVARVSPTGPPQPFAPGAGPGGPGPGGPGPGGPFGGPGYGPGPGPGFGPRPGGPGFGPVPSGPVAHRPGAGLAVGVVGLVLVVLGLFVLPWTDADESRFTDVSGNLRDVDSDAVEGFTNWLVYLYGSWAGYVLLVLVVIMVVLACVPIPPSAAGNSWSRAIGAVFAGLAAVLHTVFVTQLFRGPTAPDVSAYLAVAGYAAVMVAMVIGARRVALRSP